MILTPLVHAPAASTTLIVSLGLMTAPAELLSLLAGVVFLTVQAWIINRLSGIAYPSWGPLPGHQQELVVAPLAIREEQDRGDLYSETARRLIRRERPPGQKRG